MKCKPFITSTTIIIGYDHDHHHDRGTSDKPLKCLTNACPKLKLSVILLYLNVPRPSTIRPLLKNLDYVCVFMTKLHYHKDVNYLTRN